MTNEELAARLRRCGEDLRDGVDQEGGVKALLAALAASVEMGAVAEMVVALAPWARDMSERYDAWREHRRN